MDRRSTNTVGYTHFGGDVTAQVDSSHGVRLTGGSTGGILEAVGDDTNVTLTVRAQGAATVVLASTNQGVRLNSTTTILGSGSTTPIANFDRYLIQYTVPALSSGAASASTVTVTGLTTNSILTLTPRGQPNSTVTGVLIVPHCSTANEAVLTFFNVSVSSLSGSTHSAYLGQYRF